MTDGDVAKLAKEEKEAQNNYTEIDLSRNSITSEGVGSIVDICKQCPDLRILKLFNNQIDDEGARAIGDIFRHCQVLEEIHLSHNKFTRRGMEILVEVADKELAPSAPRPFWLRMEHNHIDDAENAAREMEKQYESVCGLEDTVRCNARKCVLHRRIHLHVLIGRGKGGGRGDRRDDLNDRGKRQDWNRDWNDRGRRRNDRGNGRGKDWSPPMRRLSPRERPAPRAELKGRVLAIEDRPREDRPREARPREDHWRGQDYRDQRHRNDVRDRDIRDRRARERDERDQRERNRDRVFEYSPPPRRERSRSQRRRTAKWSPPRRQRARSPSPLPTPPRRQRMSSPLPEPTRGHESLRNRRPEHRRADPAPAGRRQRVTPVSLSPSLAVYVPSRAKTQFSPRVTRPTQQTEVGRRAAAVPTRIPTQADRMQRQAADEDNMSSYTYSYEEESISPVGGVAPVVSAIRPSTAPTARPAPSRGLPMSMR